MTKVIVIGALLSLIFMGFARAEEPSEIVLQTIAMESASQDDFGMYLVASVIVNRGRASNKPLEAICKAPKQFSCWNDRTLARTWLNRHYDGITRSRAIEALKRAVIGPERAIRHYHTRDVMPYWAVGHIPTIRHGKHLFYEGIK